MPRLRRPAQDRRDVTRAEFNHIAETLDKRGDMVDKLARDLEIQIKRMAQMQLELDEIRLAWQRSKQTPTPRSEGQR